MRKYIVFDHDHGLLENLAKAHDFQPTEATRDEPAAAELATGDWAVALVHIDPEPWRMLCESVSDERVLVRFSTQGFPPIPPQGTHVLALHCLKKTSDLEFDDIAALTTEFSHADAVSEFREGIIPQRLQQLIAFEQPHRMRALHILLQGVLAFWASNPPGSQYGKEAARLLGISSIPKLPKVNITQMSILWRGLGLEADGVVNPQSKRTFRDGVLRELGLKDFEGASDIDILINHILESREMDIIRPDLALPGFKAIDNFVCKL